MKTEFGDDDDGGGGKYMALRKYSKNLPPIYNKVNDGVSIYCFLVELMASRY